MLEVSINNPAGKSLGADPDTLQHTVTAELVDNQVVVHDSCRKVHTQTGWHQTKEHISA